MLIGGRDEPGLGWTYVVRASAWIADAPRAFNLKRGLELASAELPPADANADVVARCAWGDSSHNEQALAAAAQASETYRRFSVAQLREIGADLHRELVARADELVEILIAEGHPRRLAQWEVSGVVQGIDELTRDWYYRQFHQRFAVAGRELQLLRKPDGVVCVNPPQNAAASNSAMGALALLAGNALVVKAPRSTPTGVMFLYREIAQPVLERHGAPPGTLNLISGDTQRILKQWLASPHVDDVLFFGSSSSGLRFGSDCYAAGKKPILELSGNDGLLVWHDADLDGAAHALSECFLGSGQICMVPKYAIVHPAVAEQLLAMLTALAGAIQPGYPEDPDVVLSPVLKQDQFFDFLSEAREAGCEILTGGQRVGVDGNPDPAGLFLQPTVIRVNGLADARRLSCVREETFFPMLPVIVPDSAGAELLEETLRFMNANAYGLRNSLWSSDEHVIETFVRGLSNGGLLKINDSHVGFVPILATHGGTANTGGPTGELNYVILRTTHLQGVSRARSPVGPAPRALSPPAP
ncbi:MAG TPA: aldehyde dehydrogenase [Solirubrobacteraceae bacterium]|jgi:acyl-CoA reductase-like NAD-dependent aldehyde dehydrogenase|nr:aldehyde dehydrogenase [Solirubrobacteraceae bacterium]